MNLRLVCVTGAESSGKTTLATALANHLDARLVPEAARRMLTPQQTYDIDDVVRIGLTQADNEDTALADHGGWVVADTDLTVIRIWLRERFDVWPTVLAERFQARAPRAYVLCAPDMPWQPDPLREHPYDRERLHQQYRQLLEGIGDPVLEVSGSVAQRLALVTSWLSSLEPR